MSLIHYLYLNKFHILPIICIGKYSRNYRYFYSRGSQYASYEYQMLLKDYHIQGSMSRKGNCWDNAIAESFFHTLKVELVHHEHYATREEAQMSIFDYIETFYNR